MNLHCPNCQKQITIPDQYAGQLMKCPLCSNTFTAPALPPAPGPSAMPAAPPSSPPPSPAATEDIFSMASPPAPAPAPPPPFKEPLPSPGPTFEPSGPPPATPPPLPSGYRRTVTLWISPRVVPWIAPAGLVLVFILLFFLWIRLGDLEEPSQTGWGTAFGKHNSALGIFYFLLYFVALVLALASTIVPRIKVKLPGVLQQLWPWRSAFVAGLTFLSFVFLVLECVVGFGLESDLRHSPLPESIANWFTSSAPKDLIVVLLYRTLWLELAVLCHLAAVVGSALDFCLVLRKSRPLPRIDISW